MRSLLQLGIGTLLLGGGSIAACKQRVPVERAAPVDGAEELLDRVLARPTADAVRSRFHFKVRSALGNVGTGGALIVDRPGRGHLAIMGPLGRPLVTLHTDGRTLSVVDRRSNLHLVEREAEAALREATQGLAGVDDVLGLLLGEVPVAGLVVRRTSRTSEGQLRIDYAGPQDSTLGLWVRDPEGTPARVEVTDHDGASLLVATYGAFELSDEGAASFPTEASLSVARFEFELDLRFRTWSELGDDVPEVFGLEAPEGFRSAPLAAALRHVLEDAETPAD